MDRNDLERFRRHSGKGATLKLESADGTVDEFQFKPLSVDCLPEFVYLASVMDYTRDQKKKVKEIKQKIRAKEATQDELDALLDEYDEEANGRLLQRENFKIIIGLIDQMVENSYPHLSKEVRSDFIMANLNELQSILMELNQDMSKKADQKILAKVEELKKRRRDAQAK